MSTALIAFYFPPIPKFYMAVAEVIKLLAFGRSWPGTGKYLCVSRIEYPRMLDALARGWGTTFHTLDKRLMTCHTLYKGAHGHLVRDELYEQDLYYRLEGAKPRFLALLDVPPRSSAEETELKSGKATIGGQQKTYNNDFVQEALFLAAQLDCSERYAAGILEQVLSGYPNDDPVASAVKVVDQFHACRRHALDTLRLVLESAMGMHPVNAEVQTRLTDYAVALVETTTELGGSRRGTLAVKILQQINKSRVLLQQQQNNQRNADSNTVIGTNNIHKFGSDIYAACVTSFQDERQLLGYLLFILAGSGKPCAGEVVHRVSWLAAASPDEPVKKLA
ncbi:hypothetical protein FRC07_003660, partial [Ceratobasidium sp. 392]